MQAETYVREALRLFAIDPPDTTYQHGFLEALVIVATEGMGIPKSDPDIANACSANKLAQATDAKVLKLIKN